MPEERARSLSEQIGYPECSIRMPAGALAYFSCGFPEITATVAAAPFALLFRPMTSFTWGIHSRIDTSM
jgi:hypothetical protein